MSFDLAGLKAAVAAYGQVVRIVIARVEGSAPRDVGASMLVWKGGQSGTIGGGALEWQATGRARRRAGRDWSERLPLGPALGQCCGGSVTLLAETYDADRLDGIGEIHVLRRIEGHADVPLKIKQTLAVARNSGHFATLPLTEGWMLESVSALDRPLWIYGAGHVGRALVGVLASLPEFVITWVDTSDDRFPPDIPKTVTKLVASNPAEAVRYAPPQGEHLIVTYSHTLDLELCHRLLLHGFTSAGLIGSRSKWARFRSRLRQLGHPEDRIDRIMCPIGQPELGKHPQAIAVGVAATLLFATVGKENAEGLAG